MCLQRTFATFLVGQASDPVAEAGHLMKKGQPDKALELLNPLSATNPEPKGAEYLRGLILYEKGDLQEAEAAFAKASAQDPADLEAMKMQGASLFRLGKAADAIPLLEKAQGSTQQMNVDPQYVLGLCYLDTNRFDDARHAFAAQYEFLPDSASAYLLEGRMLLRRDYLPAAEKATQKALELKPDLPSAHLLLGQIALARNDLPEAVSQFVMERNLNPMFGTVYDRLGRCLPSQRRLYQCAKVFGSRCPSRTNTEYSLHSARQSDAGGRRRNDGDDVSQACDRDRLQKLNGTRIAWESLPISGPYRRRSRGVAHRGETSGDGSASSGAIQVSLTITLDFISKDSKPSYCWRFFRAGTYPTRSASIRNRLIRHQPTMHRQHGISTWPLRRASPCAMSTGASHQSVTSLSPPDLERRLSITIGMAGRISSSSMAQRCLGTKPPEPPTNHLFHNNHDGTFTDVTAKAGLVSTGWGQGVCVGDYDNDGFDDIYVTGYGANRLFHNQGNGTFREVAQQSGVAGSGKEWGTGCAFIDYDRDGKLDLVVANYVHFDLAKTPAPGQEPGCIWKGVPVMCGPRGLASAPNILYHNLGNGKFDDVSKSSGIENTTAHYCFSVSTIDYNDDGWPDVYVACDSTPAILYRNNRNGTFTDVGIDSSVAFNEDGREQAGMGSTVADYDGDGKLDIFKTNFSDDTSTLYHNNGDGTFADKTFAAGLGINTDALGWGAAFADVDNDGWPDLLVVNGHVYPEVDSEVMGTTIS